MATPDTTAQVTLRLERTLAAPPERVFAAWTQAEALSRWFGPTDQYRCIVHACDPRPGGRYRIEMRHSGGNAHIVGGEYREVVPHAKLVFTWAWETGVAPGETLVTVRLEPEGAGTKLTLVHERFPNAEVCEKHRQGWTGSLARLPEAV
jgi:uncharacterized protein YndB with AHSA1/START domain